MYAVLFKLLLTGLSFVSKKLDERQQRAIGRDREVKKILAEIAMRSRIAKKIDVQSSNLSDDAVASILHEYYRDE